MIGAGRLRYSRSRRAFSVLIALCFLVACGGGGRPDLTGNWKADDGSGLKVIRSNGACSGMYYNGSQPLDIGGGMSCSLSSKKGSDGRYSLVVSQPPNEETLEVAFNGNDQATIYDTAGKRLFSMTRQ